MLKAKVKYIILKDIVYKICTKCNTPYLPTPEFFVRDKTTSDGFCQRCKFCNKEYRQENLFIIRKRGRVQQQKYVKRMILENPNWLREQSRKASPKERIRIKKDRIQNPEKYRSQERKDYYRRVKPNPSQMLCRSISSRIRVSLHKSKGGVHWEEVVGYSLEDLKKRLESTWIDGMSWTTYGKGEGKWTIDHIKPITHFIFSSYNDQEFKECWCLNNLQAKWDIENTRKGNRWIG